MKLKHPIKHEDRIIAEVNFRRAKGRDMVEFSKLAETEVSGELSLMMVSILTGVPREALDELDFEDWEAVNTEMQRFLPKAPATSTGGKRSRS